MSHTPDELDIMIRDMLISTACVFTDEQWQEIQQEAPWIKLEDDGGITSSQGMCKLLESVNKTCLRYE